jgi:Flp pilus assembly protein TadG
MQNSRRSRCRGGSALEAAFLLPWYLFLFVGAFDFGFYAHALISVQSAARTVAMYSSIDSAKTTSNTTNDTATCTYAKEELKVTANIGDSLTCKSLPLIVSYSQVTGASSADGNPAAQVSVTYQTLRLIPIPGILTNQLTITRTVQMRLRS